MNARLPVAIIIVALATSCGGSDSSEPRATSSPGPLVCTVQGLDYATSLDSCEAASELGRRLAIQISSPNATDAGGDIIFISICSGIQGTTKMTYSFDSDLELAKALDAQNVCPGDLSMLVKK